MSHAPSIEGRRVVFACLAIISAVAAVIHFAVSGEHFQEYWLFGVFMLVVAWLQLLWGVMAMAKPTRLLLWSGAVLNAGVVVVYIVTRTVGDVIGPTPHDVEPFGFGDGFCTVLEAILVVGCAWLLTAKMERRVDRRRLIVALATTGTVAAVLLSVALVDGGSEMVMSMSDSSSSTAMAGMNMSAPVTAPAPASVNLATASPAGDITMPNPNMQMAPGMAMASSTACTATPSVSQEKAAVNLVNASWKGASKYQSLAVAKAAGYRPITPTGRPVVHYVNRSYYTDTVLGGAVLNTAQPQSLVYANTAKGAVLAAAMYISAPHGGSTPQPGGCLTQWHVHTNLCLSSGLGVVGTTAAGTCPAGSRNRVTPAMMHVWFVPIPGGPTAVDASNSQVVQAAERVPAPANAPA
jgi:hypothetical protein